MPRWQYQGLAQPPTAGTVAETVTLDKWWQPMSVPVLPPRRPPPCDWTVQGPVEGIRVGAQNDWLPSVPQPIRVLLRPRRNDPCEVYQPVLPGGGLIDWHPDIIRRPLQSPRNTQHTAPPFQLDTSVIVVSAPVGVRVYRAGQNTTFRLLASSGTSLQRLARADTTLWRCASMSITSNLSFFRGEDVTIDFQMTPPVDITGWTILFKVAQTLGGAVQFTKTASIVDGPRGLFQVAIASADTAGLSVGRWVWDARRTDSGNKATLADGYLDLKQEVTA
jgi:hypothetical protein